MKRRKKQLFFVLISALLIATFGVACGENDEGTPEPGRAECTWDQTPIDWDEEAPNGVTPETLLSELDAEKEQEITGKDPAGEELLFTIEFSRRGDNAVFYEEKEGGCGDKLVLPATFVIKTTDGQLDEEFDVDAELQDGGLRIYKSLKKEDVNGSFEPTLKDGEKLTSLFLEASVTATKTSGRFGTRVEKSSGSGSDASVSEGPSEVFEF